MHQIVDNILKQKIRQLKKVKKNLLCVIRLENYESMTCTHQSVFEKEIEVEERWTILSFHVCNVCQGCPLTKMHIMMVEFSDIQMSDSRSQYVGRCTNNPLMKTAQNQAISYRLDGHGTIHTDEPRELWDLTFSDKQLIALASSHLSLIHLKNGTLWSRGRCVRVEQRILELVATIPRKPGVLGTSTF
jgi:5-hydroxyisourate hydrolase-like protein (transthyretin family)